MSSEMSILRKTDLSLAYYIKDIVLVDFIEKEEYIPLNYMEGISSANSKVYEASTTMLPKPTERGRGWVYFDEGLENECLRNTATYSGTAEQSNRITVYDTALSGISDQEYIIDYIDGRIITSGTVTPAYVSYYWNYVSLVDEWSTIEAADPPVVVIDIHGTDKIGYQLGGGKRITRVVDLHIFASSTAERNDLVERLYDSLYNRSIPMYDFPNGTVLDYDGTFYGRRDNLNKNETLFDRTVVSGVGNILFDKIKARNVNLPLTMSRGRNEVMLSDLNAYRSKISFEMTNYTNI